MNGGLALVGSGLGTTVLGMAATLLALAVLVQVVQEIYKFLTSSKARTYHLILNDFLGPWSAALLREGALNDVKMRGPLQLGSRTPRRWLLPMPAEALQSALETTTTPWCQRVLKALTLEASLCTAGPPRSPGWNDMMVQLEAAAAGEAPGAGTARELLGFIHRWSEEANAGVQAMLTAFRAEFLPHVDAAVKSFPQLMQQFEFAYRRRNLRQTFIFGFLLAFLGGFPINAIYQKAIRMTPEQALALADAAVTLADSTAMRMAAAPAEPDSGAAEAGVQASDSTVTLAIQDARKALALLRTESPGRATWFGLPGMWPAGWLARGEYLFGCLLTALLVSFGAPFWNDLTKSLVKVQRERHKPINPPAEASET